MSFKTLGTNLEWRISSEVEGVVIGDARRDGPTVGIIGGVHGDEPAGTEVVGLLPRDLLVDYGRVIVMQGNPRAVRAQTRQTEQNLNRSFKPLAPADRLRDDLPYEVNRAQELMGYIDQCRAILDLHEYEAPDGTPFIICERPSLKTARRIGTQVVAFGFAEAEAGGTDGYGYSKGIDALCYEIGAMGSQFTAGNVRFGMQVVDRFLAAQELTEDRLEPLHTNPLLIEVDKDSAHIRIGDTFEFARKFRSFESLQRGELVAVDGGNPIRSSVDVDQVIIFPKPTAPDIGREAFELGRVVDS